MKPELESELLEALDFDLPCDQELRHGPCSRPAIFLVTGHAHCTDRVRTILYCYPCLARALGILVGAPYQCSECGERMDDLTGLILRYEPLRR